MATKAELEYDDAEYSRRAAQARDEVNSGDVLAAIQTSRASWPYISGMLQYTRKHRQATVSTIETIDYVLRYAPVFFDRESLDQAAELFRSQKSILKHDSSGLAGRLETARSQLQYAYQLWDRLEKNPEFLQSDLRQTFGGDQDWWRWLAEIWEQQGYLRRLGDGRSYRLTLTADFDQKNRTKCPACGATGMGRKWRLWDEVACPGCGQNVVFVIL